MKTRFSIKGSLSQVVKGKIASSRQIIANLAVKVWRDSVERSGLSVRAKNRYLHAITPYKTRPGAYIRDNVARLLEAGWKAFDMKAGLLKGAQSRVIPLQLSGKAKPVFRTVTANSSGWQHPGFKGAKLVKDVRTKLASLVGEALK